MMSQDILMLQLKLQKNEYGNFLDEWPSYTIKD